MKIYAIIVTYNGSKWIEKCLTSLINSSTPLEIIVVDNLSTDNTIDIIEEKFSDIILIKSEKNLGFGRGNNIGIKYALEQGADYVFLLNQDAWLVQKNTISSLVDSIQKNMDYAILNPMHLYGSASQLTYRIQLHFADSQTLDTDLFSDLYFKKELADVYDVPGLGATAWLIPTPIIKKIGGFDPVFFHYGEDDNYKQRIVYHGYKIGINPKVSICHDVQFRDRNYGKEFNNWKKDLLIELCDVNKNVDIDVILREKRKELIFLLLRLRLKEFKRRLEIYTFLKEKAAQIKHSREQNIKVQLNWL